MKLLPTTPGTAAVTSAGGYRGSHSPPRGARRPPAGTVGPATARRIRARAALWPVATARTQPPANQPGYRHQPRSARGGRIAIAGLLAVRRGGGGVFVGHYRLGRYRPPGTPAGCDRPGVAHAAQLRRTAN